MAWASLLLAVLAAAAAGIGIFGALDAVDVVSLDPLGPAIGWVVLSAAGLLGSVTMFLLAVFGVCWCRPRLVAAVALTAAVVLPVVAVITAATIGWASLKLHVGQDLSAAGGTEVAASAGEILDTLGVGGPVRDLLTRWAS